MWQSKIFPLTSVKPKASCAGARRQETEADLSKRALHFLNSKALALDNGDKPASSHSNLALASSHHSSSSPTSVSVSTALSTQCKSYQLPISASEWPNGKHASAPASGHGMTAPVFDVTGRPSLHYYTNWGDHLNRSVSASDPSKEGMKSHGDSKNKDIRDATYWVTVNSKDSSLPPQAPRCPFCHTITTKISQGFSGIDHVDRLSQEDALHLSNPETDELHTDKVQQFRLTVKERVRPLGRVLTLYEGFAQYKSSWLTLWSTGGLCHHYYVITLICCLTIIIVLILVLITSIILR
ncbi:uncharacterized protein LOC119964859 isoform X2 [Scyliorhinus canicula]|uniref:uncharacterized protein LOC119964859 isoform X2 n=1 Tax=Scyliorhinus canicula TaxID=7830 RepID=UPI0018F6B668|nr:uncharacterized protein LOC119964859 isoform X2 [Scyliorhinus canicula]